MWHLPSFVWQSLKVKHKGSLPAAICTPVSAGGNTLSCYVWKGTFPLKVTPAPKTEQLPFTLLYMVCGNSMPTLKLLYNESNHWSICLHWLALRALFLCPARGMLLIKDIRDWTPDTLCAKHAFYPWIIVLCPAEDTWTIGSGCFIYTPPCPDISHFFWHKLQYPDTFFSSETK